MVVSEVSRVDHRVGEAVAREVHSSDRAYSVIFEDDGETAYLYGLDLTGAAPEDMPIVDALHVYDVAAVADREAIYPIEIRWSAEGHSAGLFIEGKCHAAFDFDKRLAVCRTGFPPASGAFTSSHDWDESVVTGL